MFPQSWWWILANSKDLRGIFKMEGKRKKNYQKIRKNIESKNYQASLNTYHSPITSHLQSLVQTMNTMTIKLSLKALINFLQYQIQSLNAWDSFYWEWYSLLAQFSSYLNSQWNMLLLRNTTIAPFCLSFTSLI
jgi:hypothetical protein